MAVVLPVTTGIRHFDQCITHCYLPSRTRRQGVTTDQAAVVIDDFMTAPQLHVAMSRGREANHALMVLTEIVIDDHDQRSSVDAIELLTGVMCREGEHRSAHEVMLSGLNRYGELSLLRDPAEEERQLVDREAGPDRSRYEGRSLGCRCDLGDKKCSSLTTVLIDSQYWGRAGLRPLTRAEQKI